MSELWPAATIAQIEALMAGKVTVPGVAQGGEKGLGGKVGEMVTRVAADIEAHTLIARCRPDRRQPMIA